MLVLCPASGCQGAVARTQKPVRSHQMSLTPRGSRSELSPDQTHTHTHTRLPTGAPTRTWPPARRHTQTHGGQKAHAHTHTRPHGSQHTATHTHRRACQREREGEKAEQSTKERRIDGGMDQCRTEGGRERGKWRCRGKNRERYRKRAVHEEEGAGWS